MTVSETIQPLSLEAKSIKKGFYEHYKGNVYEVIAVGRHSDTLEEMVLYKDVKDESKYWARPVHAFCEKILLDQKEVPRFHFIGQ